MTLAENRDFDLRSSALEVDRASLHFHLGCCRAFGCLVDRRCSYYDCCYYSHVAAAADDEAAVVVDDYCSSDDLGVDSDFATKIIIFITNEQKKKLQVITRYPPLFSCTSLRPESRRSRGCCCWLLFRWLFLWPWRWIFSLPAWWSRWFWLPWLPRSDDGDLRDKLGVPERESKKKRLRKCYCWSEFETNKT